ncbi:MAG TPA: hypothetical protein HPP81_06780 [Deltaproteobacteria bacterium]|nr:hypothetical protein [Deltaproteobacteria bacterium]HIJ76406.1 hypothetical protein [Deltaproteobacteria bacterium]
MNNQQNELTDSESLGCYKCHTTGCGEPGGFRSEQETPQLRNARCEHATARAGPTAKPATETISKESLPRPIASGATVPKGSCGRPLPSERQRPAGISKGGGEEH